MKPCFWFGGLHEGRGERGDQAGGDQGRCHFQIQLLVTQQRKIILTHNSQLSNFDKLLKDIFTTEIPSVFVDKVIVTDKNGNIGEKAGDDLKGAIPLNPSVDTPLSKLWNKETTSVEIFLNIKKVEEFVISQTKLLLDKYED